MNEAANAERSATEFAANARVSISFVMWERTTRWVLTLEDVMAIKVTHLAGSAAAEIDPLAVTPVFAAVMFDQLSRTGSSTPARTRGTSL